MILVQKLKGEYREETFILHEMGTSVKVKTWKGRKMKRKYNGKWYDSDNKQKNWKTKSTKKPSVSEHLKNQTKFFRHSKLFQDNPPPKKIYRVIERDNRYKKEIPRLMNWNPFEVIHRVIHVIIKQGGLKYKYNIISGEFFYIIIFRFINLAFQFS